MKNKIFPTIVLVALLVACAPAPAPAYESKYEVIDATEMCQPDSLSQEILLMDYFTHALSDEEASETRKTPSRFPSSGVPIPPLQLLPAQWRMFSIDSSRQIAYCVQRVLTKNLDEQSHAGWELVSFQPIESSAYELGINYIFITVWRKEK